MANDKGKGGTEYFLENDEVDDIECNNINGNSNNIINNDDLDDEIIEVASESASSSTSSMFSQQWPRSFRYFVIIFVCIKNNQMFNMPPNECPMQN